MSETLRRVQDLVARGEYLISRHGFRELVADDIVIQDVLAGVNQALLIEIIRTCARNRPCWSCSATATIGRFT